MSIESEKIANLEKEIKRLEIRLEALIDHLNANGSFGPPYGRESYDKLAKERLQKAGL
jgi:hypothetical protein